MEHKNIIIMYQNGSGLEQIAKQYHIGKLKIKKILSDNNIPLRKKGNQRMVRNLKVQDWKIEKYPPDDGYHYVAIFKKDGKEFNDYMNQGGYLTSYIKEKTGKNIPSLYDRRQYYMLTGNYWWEQWFRIEKRKNKPTKKCPYCEWETEDTTNKSGAFEVHLREKHNITKEQYISSFPNEREYFIVSNKTLNRQISTNKNEFVICKICGKKLSRIDWRHLKQHGITKSEYIAQYGFEIVSKELHDRLSLNATMTNMEMQPSFHSKPELEISNFINSYGFECGPNRKILKGKEIDILIPSLSIAIEFNGNKFHTEWFGGKTRSYHLNKTRACKDAGIKLIQIFEDEYKNSKDIVFNKLAHILGFQKELPKIMGRKCVIKEIDRFIAEDFLTTYHIQGYDPSTVHYGAFYNNELIAVMSFLKNRKNDNDWELTRFASNFNYICCGIGGKLFKHFIKEYNPDIVKSFADRRWTIDEKNNLYCQLGFKFDGYTVCKILRKSTSLIFYFLFQRTTAF